MFANSIQFNLFVLIFLIYKTSKVTNQKPGLEMTSGVELDFLQRVATVFYSFVFFLVFLFYFIQGHINEDNLRSYVLFKIKCF